MSEVEKERLKMAARMLFEGGVSSSRIKDFLCCTRCYWMDEYLAKLNAEELRTIRAREPRLWPAAQQLRRDRKLSITQVAHFLCLEVGQVENWFRNYAAAAMRA